MGTGYTRQSSASIVTDEDILAAPLNDEFNQLEDAFDATTGHSHDGTVGEGPLISLTGSVTGILGATNGGGGGASYAASFANLKQAATTSATGVVELATDAETQTGTDTARAITPANLTAKEASTSELRANTADRILTTDITWGSAAFVALSDAATVAVDMNTGFNFSLAIGGNRTLGAPTNEKVGQSGCISVTASGSTRTLDLHADWKPVTGIEAAPFSILTTETLEIWYFVRATDTIVITAVTRRTT